MGGGEKNTKNLKEINDFGAGVDVEVREGGGSGGEPAGMRGPKRGENQRKIDDCAVSAAHGREVVGRVAGRKLSKN